MRISYSQYLDNLDRVRDEISIACDQSSRSASTVCLMPVTKNHPLDAAEYAARSGSLLVGENRVQEAVGKIEEAQFDVKWELIGNLQTNKAKLAVEKFDRIQSVDRVKLLLALDRHAGAIGKRLPVLLQINAGSDPAKFGADLSDAPALMEAALTAKNIQVDGLMTIAPLSDDHNVARSCFSNLRECRDRLEEKFEVKLPVLSMGMSGDLAEAIAEGSTMVRVGTALFGEREY